MRLLLFLTSFVLLYPAKGESTLRPPYGKPQGMLRVDPERRHLPCPRGQDLGAVEGSNTYLQENKEHSKTCPESCKLCDQVIEKALKYLVSQQQDNGGWTIKKFKGGSGWDPNLAVTSFSGLALLASGSTHKEGPFQKELGKTRDAVIKGTKGILASVRKSFVGDKMVLTKRGHRHTLPYAIMFLAHIYQIEKTDELKELLTNAANIMRQQQGDEGGYSYTGAGGTMTFMANNYCVATLMLNDLGIPTDPKCIELFAKFYSTGHTQGKDGAFGYFGSGGGEASRCAGRTADALLAMKLLGLSGSEPFQKAKEFVEKHVKDIDLGHHGAAYPLLFGGIGCFSVGDDKLASSFNKHFRDTLVKAQQEDGSIYFKARDKTYWPMDDDCGGSMYTSSLYTVTLQLYKKHLIFDKIKPLEAKK